MAKPLGTELVGNFFVVYSMSRLWYPPQFVLTPYEATQEHYYYGTKFNFGKVQCVIIG